MATTWPLLAAIMLDTMTGSFATDRLWSLLFRDERASTVKGEISWQFVSQSMVSVGSADWYSVI
jgi:hypothetical protein